MIPHKYSQKVSLLVLAFGVASFVQLGGVAKPAQAQSTSQCGQQCGVVNGRQLTCAAGLICMSQSGARFCVNPAGSQCTPSNPCCSLPIGPTGSASQTNVTPAGTNITGTPAAITQAPGGSTQGTPYPLSPECKSQCDINNDNIITKDELLPMSQDPAKQSTLLFCSQSCPMNGQAPSGGGQPQPSGAPGGGSGVIGDCSGSTPGMPDGQVDLRDVEHFRKELNGESVVNNIPTKACDLDKNNSVDIIDLTNYIRVGFSQASGAQPNQSPTTSPNGN